MKKVMTICGVALGALLWGGDVLLQAATPVAMPIFAAENNGSSAFVQAMIKARANYLKTAKPQSPVTQSPWVMSKNYTGIKVGDVGEPEKKAFDPNENIWKKVSYADKQIHNLTIPGNTSVYFARTLETATDQTLELGFGSDDGLAVLFDGKKILNRPVNRGVTANNDKVKVNLKAGKKHVLMMKIYNNTGGSGFYYGTTSTFPTQKTWDALCKQFPSETIALNKANSSFGPEWLMTDNPALAEENFVRGALSETLAKGFLPKLAAANGDAPRLAKILEAAALKKDMDMVRTQMRLVHIPSLLKAVDDLKLNHPKALSDIDQVRKDVAAYDGKIADLEARLKKGDLGAFDEAKKICDLQKKIVFSAPSVKALDDILVVKRAVSGGRGLPANWQGNTSMGKFYDNELGIFNIRNNNYKTIYRPENRGFVGDLDMHFDAERFLFSGISTRDNGGKKVHNWQIYEMNIDGTGVRQVTKNTFDDVDNYEAMYLPDERIIFTSSATFLGVPCVSGSDYVGNIHIMNKDGTGIRRLCYDQDNNWCPVLLEDGRVLYLRWEYTDSAHYFSRVLMHMNPDGTAQNEFYGSNSYWPNSLFYARPLPKSTTQFVSVVSGHHGVARTGELYVFDITKGREETQGVVQQLKPYWGNSTMGVIKDQLVNGSWPQFIYPHPLSDKQYLVSAQLSKNDEWGLYIIDTFDNMTLVAMEPGFYLFEPTPVQKTTRPPIIPDKVKLNNTESTVFIQDIYEGTGLQGVPRGSVKNLRVFQYEYSYRNMGGHYAIGMEAGWDVRRVIGTVPVYDDGSAHFIVPANTPFAILPLDAEGKALQQMRSWTVGMPGELVQCVGCHERQNQTVRPKRVIASTKAAVRPTPFYGGKRGFSYDGEIQPILNRYCIQCHDGKKNPNIPDFANTAQDQKGKSVFRNTYSYSYWALHPYVRRNGPEGNYKILIPGEFHANTSPLIQLLRKGHHGVRLDKESWDKLHTWIDINVPYYGNWADQIARDGSRGVPKDYEQRRFEMRQLYSGITEDIEKKVKGDPYDETPVIAKGEKAQRKLTLKAKNWPFTAAQAATLQKQSGSNEKMTVTLGDGQSIEFVRIPAGEFNMGSETGAPDEWPVHTVTIEKPFWMATTEITLGQYKAFDPTHTNYVYDQHYKDQVRPGYHMDMKRPMDYTNMTPTANNYQPNNPAIRINWIDAMEFCQWLSKKSGKKVTLPTEAQWEWACRGGSDKPMWYGDMQTDFGKYENLADVSIQQFAVRGVDPKPFKNPNKYWAFVPCIETVNDNWFMLAPVGTYQANPFGLKDMHGNVSEWCRDNYRPYPYKTIASEAKSNNPTAVKTVRGGSWYSVPKRATATHRQDYPAWQKVYDVGFRPIIED